MGHANPWHARQVWENQIGVLVHTSRRSAERISVDDLHIHIPDEQRTRNLNEVFLVGRGNDLWPYQAQRNKGFSDIHQASVYRASGRKAGDFC